MGAAGARPARRGRGYEPALLDEGLAHEPEARGRGTNERGDDEWLKLGVISSIWGEVLLLPPMPLVKDTDGPDVMLSTVERVQALLQEAETPVSRNWLLDQLSEHGHTTTRQRLNRALEHFFVLELAVEGSKGIQWTHNTSQSLRGALATGREL